MDVETQKIFDMWAARADEPLDSELEGHLYESEFMGTVLKHPLVFDVPYNPMFAWRSNEQLKYKKDAVADAILTGDWEQVIWLHERPYRPQALDLARPHVTPTRFWELLGIVWVDTESLHSWGDKLIRKLLGSRLEGHEHMMGEADAAALASMPPQLEVFRGFTHPDGTRKGWAWTLDEDRARWFARRFTYGGRRGLLAAGVVERDDVIAYITDRSEEEIVVDHLKVRIRRVCDVNG